MVFVSVVMDLLKRYKGLLIGVALVIVAAVLIGGGYYLGSDHVKGQWAQADKIRQDKEIEEGKARDAVTAKLQNELDKYKKLYDQEQLARSVAYQKGVQDEKDKTEAIINNLKSTNSGLWVELNTTKSKARTTEAALNNARAESASVGTAYAQLSSAYSEALLRIAADGDAGIRQLGLCQAEYVALHDYTTKLVDIINQYPSAIEAALRLKPPK